MLTEQDRQLLTAFIDGELGPRQRKAVARLVRKSREARHLLRRLQQDAHAVRALPRPALPIDLSGAILDTIKRERLQPRPEPVLLPMPRQFPLWTGVAAVASVLLLVGLGSYLFFANPWRGETSANPALAENNANENHTDSRTEKQSDIQKDEQVARTDSPATSHPPKNPGTPALHPDPDEKHPLPGELVGPPRPEGSNDTAFGAPSRNDGSVGYADVLIPSLLRVRELPLEPSRTELKTQLGKGTAFYLELLPRDGTRAFPRVQAGLRSAGIEVHADALVHARRKQEKLPTNYLFYLEDVTVEELVKILTQVGAEDVKSEKKNRAEAQFNTSHANLIVSRLTDDHRKILAGLVGVELRPIPPGTKQDGLPGVDVRKELSEQTGDQVVKSLGKPRGRQALALVYTPLTARGGAPEVKQYLEARKPVRPNTLQVVLVLRGLGR